jgi:hypothetical protein
MTPTDACRSTADVSSWTVAVEIDRGDSATLALTSGADIALCTTTRTGEGFGSTAVGVGRHPIGAEPRLTYSSSSAARGPFPTTLVGRVPPATTTVRLGFADGSDELATVANGIWLAWLARPANAVRIEAIGAEGAILGRLADPGGIQPAD